MATMNYKTLRILMKREDHPDWFVAVLEDGSTKPIEEVKPEDEIIGAARKCNVRTARVFGKDVRNCVTIHPEPILLYKAVIRNGVFDGFATIRTDRVEDYDDYDMTKWLKAGENRAVLDVSGDFYILRDGSVCKVTESEAVDHLCGDSFMSSYLLS